MTIHWKAVEQYLTVVLFLNPLTPRAVSAKPWLILSLPTFDSMDFAVALLVFHFYPVFNFEKFLILDLGTVRSERVTLDSYL